MFKRNANTYKRTKSISSMSKKDFEFLEWILDNVEWKLGHFILLVQITLLLLSLNITQWNGFMEIANLYLRNILLISCQELEKVSHPIKYKNKSTAITIYFSGT